MVRVRIPEVNVGPPLARFKRERVVEVSAKEAELLVAEGAEIIEEESTAKKGKK